MTTDLFVTDWIVMALTSPDVHVRLHALDRWCSRDAPAQSIR